MVEKVPQFGDDLVEFDTVDSMRLYIKKVQRYHQKQADKYGASSGELMREVLQREQAGKRPTPKKGEPQPWQKMGPLEVNATDPLLGRNDINLELLQSYTSKLKATSSALKAFEEIERFDLAGSSSLLLLLKDGVPERIVVNFQKPAVVVPQDKPVDASNPVTSGS